MWLGKKQKGQDKVRRENGTNGTNDKFSFKTKMEKQKTLKKKNTH